jgi:hypothetical protein
MPIPAPNLDDRDQKQLLDEASQLISQRFPNWDESSGNPGQVLLEVFAHLTEALIYRLNRLPEKAYIQFLNLIGTRLNPPTAASAALTFALGQPASAVVEIPRATRVSVERTDSGGETPIFTTDERAEIAIGQSEVTVSAHACTWVEGELAGVGTGLPGQSLRLLQPPLIQRVGHEYDLIIAVEVFPDEAVDLTRTIDFGGKRYLKWTEVENFTLEDGSFPVYNVDRVAGTIYFDPGENGKAPPAGRELRAWYRWGGGAAGNVTAGTLSVLKDSIPGFSGTVTNPGAAAGGRDTESLESALRRGPRQLHSLERAVTARDFELLAKNSSQDIARAWPFTRAENWCFARPGEVELLLVPRVPEDQLSLDSLVARQNEDVRLEILNDLNKRRTLGVGIVVNWTRYKPVRIQANLIINRFADRDVIQERVVARLNQVINPIPNAPAFSGQNQGEGWPFGQALHASQVYQICQAEPGVRFVDGVVKFLVDETPSKNVEELVPDPYQPATWYAGAGEAIYRSQDNGDGWVKIASFPGETVLKIAVHPARPGRLAIFSIAVESGKKVTHLYLSDDCGENFTNTRRSFTNVVNDAAWVTRSGKDLLLMVGSEGLLEIRTSEPNFPEAKIIVNATPPNTAFRAIAVALDDRGLVSVAVSADDSTSGVFLSNDGGRTFPTKTGLDSKRVTVLTVQRSADQRLYLWAGIGALPGDKGEGCYRWELLGGQKPPDGWKPFIASWNGGSCNALAFFGSKVAAGSYNGGVLLLDPDQGSPAWSAVNLTSGLARSGAVLESVTSLGCSSYAGGSNLAVTSALALTASDLAGPHLLAAGKQGVYRSEDGAAYRCVSTTELLDKVTLPPTRLFCAGQHDLKVWYENERK